MSPGSGTAPEIGIPMPGLVPKVIIGSSAVASIVDALVVRRAVVGGQLLPARDAPRPNPRPSARSRGRDVLIGCVVRRDQARARAAFDRHVADGHALFHRSARMAEPRVFEDAAGAAADADLRDHARE